MNVITTRKFTEKDTEERCTRDLSSLAGAEHLAKCIVHYWAARGVTITAEVVHIVQHGASVAGAVYGVRTTGIPVNRSPPEPAAIKGRNRV